MECVVLTGNPRQRERYWLALEDLGESWRCVSCGDAASAWRALLSDADVMILDGAPDSRALLERLVRRPVGALPYLLGDGLDHPALDGTITLAAVSDLPTWLDRRERLGYPSRLAVAQLPHFTCLARSLLKALSVPETLRAWMFLPDMAALITLHPPLLDDLRGRLYPLAARRHRMTPAAVERSLRLCVESVWSHGRLDALERFFGQSVDPERGKPTNREFLRRVREELTCAAHRLA